MSKKLLFVLGMALTAMSFVACGGDDEPEPAKAPVLKNPTFAEQAASLTITDANIPFKYIEFTESGRAVLQLNVNPEVKTRDVVDIVSYIAGTFAWDGNKYTIYGPNSKIICTVQTAKLGSKVSIRIEMPDGTVFEGEGTLGTKASSDATNTISRSWKVTETMLTYEAEATGGKKFTGCDLNEILEYAKRKGTFNETLSTNKKVTEIVFTRSGAFFIFYANDENDYGTWQWQNASQGTISYRWREADMGNKFESGVATFDVRKGQYALTLKADTDAGDKVSMTCYLAEK